MPVTTTTTNKPKPLATLLAGLKKLPDVPEPGNGRPVLEHMLYAVLRENAPRTEADRAFRNLCERFFDWNEVRVSSPHEVAGALGNLPQPIAKAQRIVSLLQEVFEANYSFDLDQLPKKGIKPAARQVARYQASSDFVVAWVTLHCLDGHAVPIDGPALAALKRLGVIEDDEDNLATVMASMEHQIPKLKAAAFIEMLDGMAHEARHDNRRPASRVIKNAPGEATRSPRPKPR